MRLRSSVATSTHASAVTAYAETPAGTRPRIGELLARADELSEEEVSHILHRQQATGELFGDAAVALGLVEPPTVERALREQYGQEFVSPTGDVLDPRVTTAFDGNHPLARQMRMLRATLFDRTSGRTDEVATFVITDPGVGEGGDIIAADLAVVAAQLGYEVLLVDAKLDAPSQHALFRVSNRRGVSTMGDHQDAEDFGLCSTAVRRLKLLPAGPAVPNPLELIEGAALCSRLRRLAPAFDLIVVDATRLENAAAAAAATGSDGALVLVRRHHTALDSIRAIDAALAHRGVERLGAVMIA